MAAKPDPKISTSEAVLIGMLLLGLDAIDLIPFAGDLTDVAAAPLLLYYHMKHINGVMYGVGLILDLIPATQEFPTRSLVWWGTVAFDRFAPAKVEEALEKLGEVEEGGEGGSGELESGGELGEGATEATQQGAASAEQAGESAAAEADVEGGQSGERGKPGESSSQEERTSEGAKREAGEGGQEDEGEGQEGEGVDPMRMGAEITPEEEAEEAAFGSDGAEGDSPDAADSEANDAGVNPDQPSNGGAGSRDGGGQRRRHSTHRRP